MERVENRSEVHDKQMSLTEINSLINKIHEIINPESEIVKKIQSEQKELSERSEMADVSKFESYLSKLFTKVQQAVDEVTLEIFFPEKVPYFPQPKDNDKYEEVFPGDEGVKRAGAIDSVTELSRFLMSTLNSSTELWMTISHNNNSFVSLTTEKIGKYEEKLSIIKSKLIAAFDVDNNSEIRKEL